jgi:hypothetical protein
MQPKTNCTNIETAEPDAGEKAFTIYSSVIFIIAINKNRN